MKRPGFTFIDPSTSLGMTSKSRGGFTLIELMIYIAITAIVVVALTHVMIAILETREKTQHVGELQHSLRFSMDRIVERVLSADDIDGKASRFAMVKGTLALTMPNTAISPAIFSLSAGRILLQEGKSKAEPLTTEKIQIETLRFTRIEPNGIHIVIEGIEPASGTGSLATMTLQTSVFLRP